MGTLLQLIPSPTNFRSITSIKAELIPRVVRKQFSKHVKKGDAEDEDDGGDGGGGPEGTNGEGGSDIHSFIPKDPMIDLAQRLSFWNDHSGDLKEAYHGRPLRQEKGVFKTMPM